MAEMRGRWRNEETYLVARFLGLEELSDVDVLQTVRRAQGGGLEAVALALETYGREELVPDEEESTRTRLIACSLDHVDWKGLAAHVLARLRDRRAANTCAEGGDG